MDVEKEKYLKSIYYDVANPASFGGVDVLFNYVQQDNKFTVSKGDVISFLSAQDVYTNRTRKRRPKHFIPLTVPNANHLVELDVLYMRKGGRKKFILGAIDAFSKKAAAKALSNIKSKNVTTAALELIKELKGTKYVRADQGSEFISSVFQQAMKDANIELYFATRKTKAHVIERWWRTLRARLHRAADASNTLSWEKLLPSVVAAYNNKAHRSLNGATPNEVSSDDKLQADLWFKQREDALRIAAKVIPYKFNINDPVKIPLKSKNAFSKEAALQNSDRVYFIASRRKVHGIPLYKLKNQENQLVPSSFSHSELQQVTQTAKTEYRIKKIKSYKILDGVKHAKISWQDYSSDFETYVPAAAIKNNRYVNPDFMLKRD